VTRRGLYVYCVIGTGETRNFGPIGVGQRSDTVTTIAYRDLSAVISSVPMDRYEVGQKIMLAHERVIEKVMMDHTVLPVRFCTVSPNAEEIRNLLRSRYGEFKKLLRELDNKVELGIKALWKDMNHLLRESMTEGTRQEGLAVVPKANVNRTRAETEKRVRLALEEERIKTRELVLEPLRPLADDLCFNKTYGDDMVMNVAFLVDRSREREFDARVEQLSGQYDTIEFKYVGPAPPYSFVNMVIKEQISPSPKQLDLRRRR